MVVADRLQGPLGELFRFIAETPTIVSVPSPHVGVFIDDDEDAVAPVASTHVDDPLLANSQFRRQLGELVQLSTQVLGVDLQEAVIAMQSAIDAHERAPARR